MELRLYHTLLDCGLCGVLIVGMPVGIPQTNSLRYGDAVKNRLPLLIRINDARTITDGWWQQHPFLLFGEFTVFADIVVDVRP